MCDVPSIAVFCSESIECFPGIIIIIIIIISIIIILIIIVVVVVIIIITVAVVIIIIVVVVVISPSSSSSKCFAIPHWRCATLNQTQFTQGPANGNVQIITTIKVAIQRTVFKM